MAERIEEDVRWSPEEGDLIGREESGFCPAFKFETINSEDLGRCVRAVVRGRCIATDTTRATRILKAAIGSQWHVICAVRAA